MGTWEWNIARERVTWSASLEQIHGIPVGSFPGTFEAYQRDIHPEDWPRVLERIRETLSGAKHALEYRIVRPDGEVRWLEAHGHMTYDAEGKPVRLVGVCMDVTERKIAELERARMAEFRQRLLGIVAHDLRSPLGAISIAAEALPLSEKLSPRGQAGVDTIRRATERMSRLISDLLDYTQGQVAGGIPITRAPMDMAELGRRLIRDLSGIAAPRALTFAAEGDARGEWDELRVAQVLSNLVHNALHHGEGAVRVLVRDAGDSVVMRVSNRGAPIPPALLPSILQPFARGEKGGHGLGLGLYIVNELARAHGGSVAIESTAESGTHVTVSWPRAVQTREAAAAR
jgi:signal transduction histidine kinase